MEKKSRITVPARICLAGEGCDWMLSKTASWSFPVIETVAETYVTSARRDSSVTIEYLTLSQREVLSVQSLRDIPDIHLSYGAACFRAFRSRFATPSRGMLIRLMSTIPMCGGLSSS